MATEKQGIMSLPQGGQEAPPAAPQMGLDESYEAVRGGLQDVSPEADAAMQQTLAQITPQLDQLSDEQLDSMIQIFQYLHDHPEEYDEKVKELINAGIVDEDTMPDQYDPEVLATLMLVFMEAKKQRQAGNQREAAMAMPQPPAGMARGGIADAARMVASQGRSGDTMLAHITPKEAKMLKKHGGVGTINPATGLPEYGFFSGLVSAVKGVVGGVVDAVKGVVNTVKSIVQSPVGRILGTIALATVLGPTALGATLGTAGTAALSAGTITALGGGNLKDVLRSAATSYLGAPGGPVENFIGNAGAAMGVTNAAGQAAINAGLTGAGVGLLTGQNLKDSVKSGLIAGAIQGGITGASKGFGAQAPGAANAPGGAAPAKPVTPGDVTQQIQQGGGTASTDPLGDFIQQNEQQRALANTPAREAGTAAAAAAPKFAPVPTIGESASRIGGGIMDMAQGNFSTGFEGVKGGLGDLFAPTKLSPDQLTQSPAFQSARANGASYTDALKAASDAYNPGVLRTYGPGIAAGLAATGVMGGFEPNNPAPSELAARLSGTPGEDLIKANPSKYITQNLPGVQYDATGNIIGSTPWQPSATMADVRVPTSSVGGGNYNFASVQPPTGTMYTPGVGTLGQSAQIYQPYNTPNMYTNLMYPRRAAEGGIMEIEEPVHHMMFGGIMERIARSIQPVVNAASRAVAPKQYALSDVQAAPAQYAPMPTQAAPAQASNVLPMQAAQLAAPSPGAGNMSGGMGRGLSMTPEMRAMFAQQFARNMQMDPQAAQQMQMARAVPQQQYNTRGMYANLRGGGRGLASLAEGGYPRRTGQISGPGTEKSDSIPAMLSDGEFVMTAKAVRGAGNGSRRAGAKKMYALMHQLERNASRG